MAAARRLLPRRGLFALPHAGADQQRRRHQRLCVQRARHLPARRDAAFRYAHAPGRLEGVAARHALLRGTVRSLGTDDPAAAIRRRGRRPCRAELDRPRRRAHGPLSPRRADPQCRRLCGRARFRGRAGGGIPARHHEPVRNGQPRSRQGLAQRISGLGGRGPQESVWPARRGPPPARSAFGAARIAVFPRL